MTDAVEQYHKETNMFAQHEETRTDVFCHGCDKTFVALIDFRLDGNHIIQCPNPKCNHKHYRCVEDGRVTEQRWNSKYAGLADIVPRRIWNTNGGDKSEGVVLTYTDSASSFIRERWLNRGQ